MTEPWNNDETARDAGMSRAMRREMVKAAPGDKTYAYKGIVSWWKIVRDGYEYGEDEADRVVLMLTHPTGRFWLHPAVWNAMTGEQQAEHIDRIVYDEVQD